MLIFTPSVSKRLLKIHWSSVDDMIASGKQTSCNTTHIPSPNQKLNPNKQVQRKISNIDRHKYLGFRTLKDLKPFQQVSVNTVTFVHVGSIRK